MNLIKEHSALTVNNILNDVGGVDMRIIKLEKSIGPLLSLSLMGQGGANVLDHITEHVLSSGFSAKVRELRQEFFSKHDFTIASTNFVKPKDFDTFRKDMENKLSQ